METNGAAKGDVKDTLVVGQTSQGADVHGALLRCTRLSAVFEVYGPGTVFRTSEVIGNFKIVMHDRTLYLGRAVIRNLIQSNVTLICDVALEEGSWIDLNIRTSSGDLVDISSEYRQFMSRWEKSYKVRPEFKIVVADMQSFLMDLRLWVDQVELVVRSCPGHDRAQMERRFAEQLASHVVPTFDTMHERLEELAEELEPELRPVHQSFSMRHLHPLMLCSPFAYRTFTKPLGYAGDYEMVNMIVRSPYEGGSLFAMVVNSWFLSQWPAKAHRNRIDRLTHYLQEETLRVLRTERRKVKVLNFACGPAIETQQFLKNSELSDRVEFTMVDFNGETIEHARNTIAGIKNTHNRRTEVVFAKKSVHQVLKERRKSNFKVNDSTTGYDLIVCAGLFDYLPDGTCRELTKIFYDELSPGGMVLVTTVNDYKPFRNMLEFVLDWHLIYRGDAQAKRFIPDNISAEQTRVTVDSTGVNLFVEMRKPSHG